MKEKYFAYRCPDCGDTVLALMGSFSLSGDLLRLRCPCGGSYADIRAERAQKVHLSVPCPICKKEHSYTIAPSLLLEKELFTLGCPYSPDIATALMGEREPLDDALAKEGEKLSTLLRAFESDTLADLQPQDMNDEEILPDPTVYDTIRFLVRELEADGLVHCPCGRGSYDFRLTDDGIQVVCPDCGASYEFLATSPEAAQEYLTIDSLHLK